MSFPDAFGQEQAARQEAYYGALECGPNVANLLQRSSIVEQTRMQRDKAKLELARLEELVMLFDKYPEFERLVTLMQGRY